MIAGIQSRIECSVRILSQASYIYRTTYEGKDAVLKLAWMPTSLLPEGAAYQLLKNKCKDLIPEVYASGVVEQDRFGYRLDFMVIEHCGETIGELARKHYDNQEEFEAIVCSAISQASACIAKAYSAGVIHRDISTGNIAIKNGKTKVIDWGLARLLDNVEIDGISDVEEAWYFRRYIISTTQAMSSLIIGTPLFMSIQTLLGTRSRGLMDDIESMFYVALYALGVFYETIDAYSLLCGFQCNDEETKSVSRLGCLMDKDAYLEQFGILHCQEATTAVLNSMYKFLFYEKDINIAGRLLGDKDRERHVNIDFARGFMDASLLLPDVAPNPPLRAQKIRRVQTQSMTINDRAGDEGCIAKRTRSRTRHVKK
ncbi:hypothetical protein GGI11_004373 [Coemansia sp. RSA 2049]|nr:hypothetical protein GGI11_004373 [Coemansia sp. RSA 2049]KAJ2519553.1 hypothetical protein H4217_002608 [Coemansia sp. RSA 1939]KAJ2612847.1 hypothetical protein EV177_002789 [Coemansia sp. RSA 1804]